MKKYLKSIISCSIAAVTFCAAAITSSAYDYLNNNQFGQTTTFSVKTTTVGAPYFGYFDSARGSWNNVSTWPHISGTNLTDSDSSTNIVKVQSYDETWYGAYTPHGNPFSYFKIRINTSTIEDKATSLGLSASNKAKFYKSVMAHELGHALGLADDPSTTEQSLMKHSRDRTTIVGPQSYDIAAVDSYYYSLSGQSTGSQYRNSQSNSPIVICTDYQWYNGIEELFESADLVVQGKAVQSKDVKLNVGVNTKDSMPYIVSTFNIEKTFKGDSKTNTIEVKQLGGKIKDETYWVQDAEYLKEDRTYILFLKTYDDSPASLLNPVQGMYHVADNENIISREKNDIKLDMNMLNSFVDTRLPSETYELISDYYLYDDYDALYNDADLIIAGEVTKTESLMLNISTEDDDPLPYTVSSVHIHKILKGDYKSNNIDIKQLGGVIDNINYYAEGIEYLEKGQKYVLFLKTFETSPASLVNPIQGMYYLKDDNVIPRDNNKLNVNFKNWI